jgi:hypothetical protein
MSLASTIRSPTRIFDLDERKRGRIDVTLPERFAVERPQHHGSDPAFIPFAEASSS